MSQGHSVALVRDRPRHLRFRPAVVLLSALLRAYQVILSPLLRLLPGAGCRFYPSCSEYALQSIQIHGALRGSFLALKRLCRCHPFHSGGYDPPVQRS